MKQKITIQIGKRKIPAVIYFIVMFFIFPSGSLKAQDANAKDSLQKELKTAKHDSDRINILLHLVEVEYDPKVWPVYNNEALSLAEKNLKEGDSRVRKTYLTQKAACLGNIGYGFWEQGNVDSCIYYSNLSYEIKEELGDKTGMANSLNNIAYMYQQKGDISNALERYNRCIALYEEMKDQKGLAYSYANIGKLYAEQEDFENALLFQNRALDAAIKANDKNAQAFIHNGISYVYQKKNQPDLSLQHLEIAMRLSKEIDDKRGQAEALVNMGTIAEGKDSLVKALRLYFESLGLYRKAETRDGEGRALTYIASVELKMDSIEAAKNSAAMAMAIAEEIQSPERIRNAAEVLSKIFKSLAEGTKSPADQAAAYAEALRYSEVFKTMSDSFYNETTQKNTMRQQLRYDFEKKASEQRAESRRQKLISYGIAGALAAVVIFSIVLFGRLRVIRKQKTVIEEQKRFVEHQKTLVEEKQREIVDSISYAKRLQEAILPPKKVRDELFRNSFVLYLPKDIVAGDFYWVEKSATHIFIAAADCTGHGVPGALVSVVCSNALNRAVKEFGLFEPGAILDKARELVVETFEKSEKDVMDGMDISLAVFSVQDHSFGPVVKWAGANNPIWLVRDGQFHEFKGDKQPVGKHDFAKNFTTHEIELLQGDMMYLFTDGFADQFGGEKGKKFKYSQLKEKLVACSYKPASAQEEELKDIFSKWKGNLEQVDDVCIIGIRL